MARRLSKGSYSNKALTTTYATVEGYRDMSIPDPNPPPEPEPEPQPEPQPEPPPEPEPQPNP